MNAHMSSPRSAVGVGSERGTQGLEDKRDIKTEEETWEWQKIQQLHEQGLHKIKKDIYLLLFFTDRFSSAWINT